MSSFRYRVASKFNFYKGIYKSASSFEMSDLKGRHPMPHNDIKLVDFYEERCGHTDWLWAFSSLEQLKFWIYRESWRIGLQKEGFIVYVIGPRGEKGDDWEVGETQAMFSEYSELKILEFDEI